MEYCYHTTKLQYLRSILQSGLQPDYGRNSSLVGDKRKGKIYYSAGIQATVKMFSSFDASYYRVHDENINEEEFKRNLSSEDYIKHQKYIKDILNSKSFEDFIKDNVYLCFSGERLSDKNEDKPMDSYTSESISPDQLSVCVIRKRSDGSIYAFSMKDIYSYFNAKDSSLETGLEVLDFEDTINKYQSDEYYMDYISLQRFCDMYPELTIESGKVKTVILSEEQNDDYDR